MDGSDGILRGVRVVEAGGGLAAPIVGMVLAEQGAEVVRVTDPSRPPADPVLDAFFARGKVEVALDPAAPGGREALARLLAVADVFLEDDGPSMPAAAGVAPAAVRDRANPGLIHARIPAFAAADPRSGLPGYEAVAGAAASLYEKPLGAPRFHEFPVPSVMAALFAANALVAALIARERTGRGQDVEVARFHATIFAQILQVLMKAGVPRGFLPLKMIGTPFMGSWRCRDGRYVYLHITLPGHNARILEVLEGIGLGHEVAALRAVLSPETMRDPSQVKSIPEAKKIRVIYERIFLERDADEWERLLGQELCCIKVRTVEEWLRDSIEAGMNDACRLDDPALGPLTGPGPIASCAALPPVVRPRAAGDAGAVAASWEAAPRPARAPAAATTDLRHPLQGIRVADLSRIIAGPCAARVLAELGADVLSIQSPTGLDWALSFHLMFNAGKRSVTLDFTGDEGKRRLWAILDDFKPHAFIQNYRHLDVARQAGIDPDAVRARFPDIAYTHLNAYGNEGIWRDRPGFEQVVQAVSGIQLSYGENGRPRLLTTPVIDIGSGLMGAFATLLGLYRQARTGTGVFVTTHLTRTAVLLQARQVAASQRERALATAAARGRPVAWDPARQVVAGLVRVSDGHACIAGPDGDVRRWIDRAGLNATGAPGASGKGNPIASLAGAVRRRKVAALQESVRAAGLAGTVAVTPVVRVRRLLDDLARSHPDGDAPAFRRDYPGCAAQLSFVRGPMRLSATPAVDISPPRMRGADTRDVLARVGVAVPEGEGVIPYPPNKPFLPWLLSFIRWGYFAWRSGSI